MTDQEFIDLRSDTVTKPGQEMRRAMASAEVGDDVYGEDPTVNRLQEEAAELLGAEAALFVPTGTMANQLAIKLHTRPGDEVLIGEKAHMWLFESGAGAALSGVQFCFLPGDGRFSADAMRDAFKPYGPFQAPTKLVAVENTHNMGGGLVWDPTEVARVVETASALGIPAHLDGARIWNAAASTGKSEQELAAGFDSVSICLSKGLGAPVGSLLCGSRPFVDEAVRYRKMFGGGMRQAGILAAAGLYALRHHRARVIEDHENARFLAESLNQMPGLTVALDGVHSNIVMVDVDVSVGAPAIESAARSQGVLFSAMSPTRLRLVTHLDVGRRACSRVVEVVRTALS